VLWLGVALWGLLMVGLWLRLPRLFGAGVLLSLLLLSALLTLPGGFRQGLAPLLLTLLALGLFLPPARPARASRVAPRKNLRSAKLNFGGAPTTARDTTSPLDLWDIPGYEVLEKIGSGGMASVYRARRKRDGETVALKIPGETFVPDEKFMRRFHREAEVAQRLTHPNIVQTFEHGSVGAKHYMVMEFVDGYSLESYLDDPERRSDYTASCELMRQAVAALLYIHEAGVVHRDIKPANLMLRRDGLFGGGAEPDALKLMDFGIAGGQLLSKLTVAGARVGTPTYMSPEQARGLRSDERSDIYSLGLVFYELLTGQPAFRGGYEVIVHQQIFQLPPPPRQLEPRVPAQLERLVMQMIAKEPEARPSLAEVAYRLSERFEVHETASRSRLLCALGAPQGALRILDTGGNLHSVPGDLGAALPAPPQACIGDALGNLYVAVTEAAGLEADCMLHKLGPDGELLRSFGRYGMKPGEFLRPVALALAPDGSLWILDAETHRVEHFTPDGLYLGGFGGAGGGEGRFNDPRDLLSDAHGELFVLDYGNRQVQHFGPEGRYKNRWAFRLAGAVTADGPASLLPLSGFALSSSGDLYLGEAAGGKVHRVAPRGGALDTLTLAIPVSGVSASGTPVSRAPASAPVRGSADDARPDTLVAPDTLIDMLVDMGIDDAGNLFAAERGGSAIRKYAPSGELLATLETYAPILQLRVDVRA
jgi:serine/threonine protein kinase/streptogramin lyase